RMLLAALLVRATELAREPRPSLPVALALGAADDAAYAAGLWRGCLRERTLAPLLPRLVQARRSPRPRIPI
ncbi:MAG TPA: hypothetical protein VFS37_16385, partial [Conexibacter sp.]|nr:hypothetical protein [Conexibacter sp.]